MNNNEEVKRLEEAREGKVFWKKWGPYLSERQWGTVREDYSEGGDAWNFFTHDRALDDCPRADLCGAKLLAFEKPVKGRPADRQIFGGINRAEDRFSQHEHRTGRRR